MGVDKEIIDIVLAVVESFRTHLKCPKCGFANEIRNEWYSGMVADSCLSCKEDFNFKELLGIEPNAKFMEWVSKRTYENDPVEDSRIVKKLEYEITKSDMHAQHYLAERAELMKRGEQIRFEPEEKEDPIKKRIEFETPEGDIDYIEFEYWGKDDEEGLNE